MPLSQGQILNDRYRVIKLLGMGGFGAVYCAWDTHLNCQFALKENLLFSSEANIQFLREAQILSGINHPNLPRVLDYFLIAGQGQYLVMDFIDGKDLNDLLIEQGGPLPLEKVLEWIGQICEALIYLHSQTPPIIHRDIKPSNIRITPLGKAVLVDFGIAKLFDPVVKTIAGARVATPGYSPPEQFGLGITDEKSDVFALSATVYHLLTGLIPPSSMDVITGDVPPPQPVHLINNEIPFDISSTIEHAMKFNRKDRLNSVVEFKLALINPPNEFKSSSTRAPFSSSILTKIVSYKLVREIENIDFDFWLDDALGFALDYKILASGGPSGLKVWNVEDGKLLGDLYRNYIDKYVFSISFTKDGQYIACAFRSLIDYRVDIWRVKDHFLIKSLDHHHSELRCVTFSPDGEILASGSFGDKLIRLWRVSDGELLNTLKGHLYPVTHVSFTPDGKNLISYSIDESLRIWRVNDGNLLRIKNTSESSGECMEVSPDGLLIANTSGNHNIYLWNLSDWRLINILEGHNSVIKTIAFSPNGEFLASGSLDMTLRLWRVFDGNLEKVIDYKDIDTYPNYLKFSSDGKFLYSVLDSRIRVYRLYY